MIASKRKDVEQMIDAMFAENRECLVGYGSTFDFDWSFNGLTMQLKEHTAGGRMGGAQEQCEPNNFGLAEAC
jgi:hypothetical protein